MNSGLQRGSLRAVNSESYDKATAKLTRLRVEVFWIAHLDWARCSMYCGIVVDRVFVRYIFRVDRRVCLTL